MPLELQPITNRAADGDFLMPADNLIQLVPLGEFGHAGSGLTQVLDAIAIETMVAQFGQDGGERLVDFDHESLDNNKRTQAAGWIQNLQARADGLWGRIRWSKSGKDAVRGGDYRFISPVFLPSECEGLGNSRVRPLRLESCGLTNKPNLLIAAMANRADDKPKPLQEDAFIQWNEFVRGIRAEKKTTFENAWEMAKLRNPQDWQRLAEMDGQSTGHPAALPNRLDDAPAPSLTNKGDPVVNWESKVKLLQTNEGLTFAKAWDRAQAKHPYEYGQYVQEHERQTREHQRTHKL